MGLIILFYKYCTIRYPKQVQKWQRRLCEELGLTGRVIIATEGINGTLGGTREAIERYCTALRAHELFADIDIKESEGNAADFPRLSVLVRPEIVTLGISPEELPATQGGRHLAPHEAHALLTAVAGDEQLRAKVVVLDGRNSYESAVGAFVGAVRPAIENFRDFPRYIDEHCELFRNKIVLMYCTGGVRCERASAYLQRKQVAQEVLQITGGIHRYVEAYPQGFFKGKNYVFDKRTVITVSDDIVARCMHCAVPSDRYQPCGERSCRQQLILCEACASEREVACTEHALTPTPVTVLQSVV